jgi:hypothetical protein
MKKLILIALILICINSSGQVAKEHKDFLQSLYWDIPNATSLIQATKLLNESPIFSEIKVVMGQLQAYASSNPYFKSDSRYGNNSTTSVRLRMFFEGKDGKSSERRILIYDQKSKQIGNTMVGLLKSISYSFKISEEDTSTKYEFFYKKESKDPFFIIETYTAYGGDKYDIWLSFIEERLNM